MGLETELYETKGAVVQSSAEIARLVKRVTEKEHLLVLLEQLLQSSPGYFAHSETLDILLPPSSTSRSLDANEMGNTTMFENIQQLPEIIPNGLGDTCFDPHRSLPSPWPLFSSAAATDSKYAVTSKAEIAEIPEHQEIKMILKTELLSPPAGSTADRAELAHATLNKGHQDLIKERNEELQGEEEGRARFMGVGFGGKGGGGGLSVSELEERNQTLGGEEDEFTRLTVKNGEFKKACERSEGEVARLHQQMQELQQEKNMLQVLLRVCVLARLPMSHTRVRQKKMLSFVTKTYSIMENLCSVVRRMHCMSMACQVLSVKSSGLDASR